MDKNKNSKMKALLLLRKRSNVPRPCDVGTKFVFKQHDGKLAVYRLANR